MINRNMLLRFVVIVICAMLTSYATPSMSGNSINFKITGAIVTRQPQFFTSYAMSGINWSQPGSKTQQVKVEPNFKRIVPKQLESFFIIDFTIADVSQDLKLSTRDMLLVDGKGVAREAFGAASHHRPDAWDPFSSITLNSQKAIHTLHWIFNIPNDAIKGSIVRVRGVDYPLVNVKEK